MDTRSHYFSPVVGDPICESRYMTHDSRPPSRRRSHASSRASSRLSGVDMSWLGPYMTKIADDTNVRKKRMSDEANELEKRMSDEANEREKRMLDAAKRLADEANLREQRMLEEVHAREQLPLSRENANLEMMKELLRERESAALAREQLNYEREEKHQTLASRREETIRQEMRQYAAIEARAAALQEQLRAEQLKPTKLATVDTLWPAERTTSRTSSNTDPCVSRSSQSVYPVASQTTADLSGSTLSTVGYTSSSVTCLKTLSTDTVIVSSDKYPCIVSAPLVSQQQLGTTVESLGEFTQSLAMATGQTVSQSLMPSASHEIAGLITATAGQRDSRTQPHLLLGPHQILLLGIIQ